MSSPGQHDGRNVRHRTDATGSKRGEFTSVLFPTTLCHVPPHRSQRYCAVEATRQHRHQRSDCRNHHCGIDSGHGVPRGLNPCAIDPNRRNRTIQHARRDHPATDAGRWRSVTSVRPSRLPSFDIWSICQTLGARMAPRPVDIPRVIVNKQ